MTIHITPTPGGDGWDVEMTGGPKRKSYQNVSWRKAGGLVSEYVDMGVRLGDPRWCYWCDRGKKDCACEAETNYLDSGDRTVLGGGIMEAK